MPDLQVGQEQLPARRCAMEVTTVLHDVLDAAADRHPEAPAVRHGAEIRTYRQLYGESSRLAAQLLTLGVRRGNRVLIALPSSVLVPALLFGCSRIGAVFIVINPDTPTPVATHVLEDATPALVVATSRRLHDLAGTRNVRTVDPNELASGVDTLTDELGGRSGP